MIQELSMPTVDLVEMCRLLRTLARDRQRFALEAQRRRLVRSIVTNDVRRRGLN